MIDRDSVFSESKYVLQIDFLIFSFTHTERISINLFF